MIPGSNILNTALSVIAKQPFTYFQFLTRVLQVNALYLNNYALPVPLLGSVQAVPRDVYEREGLLFDKYYLKIFVPQNVIDISRDDAGDLIMFNGNMYECESVVPWFQIDGWVEITAVQVQNIPLITSFTGPSPGRFNTGQPLTFAVDYSYPVLVTNTPTITLSPIAGLIHGNAAYTSGSGTNALLFSYTVQSSDTAVGITASSPISGNINNGIIPANSTFIPPDLTGITLN